MAFSREVSKVVIVWLWVKTYSIGRYEQILMEKFLLTSYFFYLNQCFQNDRIPLQWFKSFTTKFQILTSLLKGAFFENIEGNGENAGFLLFLQCFSSFSF